MKKTQSSFLEKVDLGARLAVAKALAEHKRKGNIPNVNEVAKIRVV